MHSPSVSQRLKSKPAADTRSRQDGSSRVGFFRTWTYGWESAFGFPNSLTELRHSISALIVAHSSFHSFHSRLAYFFGLLICHFISHSEQALFGRYRVIKCEMGRYSKHDAEASPRKGQPTLTLCSGFVYLTTKKVQRQSLPFASSSVVPHATSSPMSLIFTSTASSSYIAQFTVAANRRDPGHHPQKIKCLCMAVQ